MSEGNGFSGFSGDTGSPGGTGGTVRIESEPEGALVFENGVFTGFETNVTLTGVTPGRHVYELQFDCYDDSERPHQLVVHVKAGQEVVHFVDMTVEAESDEDFTGDYGGASPGEPPYGDSFDSVGTFADGRPVYRGNELASPGNVNSEKPIYIDDEPGKEEKIVTQSNVPAAKRIAAAFIDFYFIGMLLAILGSVFSHLGGGLLSGMYILLRDGLFSNSQSIGKMVLGFHVQGPGGRPCTLEDSVIRNWPLCLTSIISSLLALTGLYALIALMSLAGSLLFLIEFMLVCIDSKGFRLGDRFAGTITRQGTMPYHRLTAGREEPPMLT